MLVLRFTRGRFVGRTRKWFYLTNRRFRGAQSGSVLEKTPVGGTRKWFYLDQQQLVEPGVVLPY